MPGRRSKPGVRRSRALRVAILAAGLFLAGLATGRLGATPTPVTGPGGLGDRLVAAIQDDAASNRSLVDVEDSGFTYSNVSIRRLDGGHVDAGPG